MYICSNLYRQGSSLGYKTTQTLKRLYTDLVLNCHSTVHICIHTSLLSHRVNQASLDQGQNLTLPVYRGEHVNSVKYLTYHSFPGYICDRYTYLGCPFRHEVVFRAAFSLITFSPISFTTCKAL